MLTKNFKRIIGVLSLTGTRINTGGSSKALVPLTTISGATVYMTSDAPTSSSYYPFAAYNTPRDFVPSSANAGIGFGSGTTPPTEDDYFLEDRVGTGMLQYTLVGENAKYEEGIFTTTKIITVMNGSTQPVTISEVAYIQACGTRAQNSTTGSTTKSMVMLDRTLLDEPVTLEPGDNAQIEYVLSFDVTSNL